MAPNGTAWKISKATFKIPDNLLFGENLDEVILEGVNTLSLEVDGNLTIGKNIIGSPVAADPHVQGGSLIDGYDGFYADDPTKGLRMGRGYLGGFGGGVRTG